MMLIAQRCVKQRYNIENTVFKFHMLNFGLSSVTTVPRSYRVSIPSRSFPWDSSHFAHLCTLCYLSGEPPSIDFFSSCFIFIQMTLLLEIMALGQNQSKFQLWCDHVRNSVPNEAFHRIGSGTSLILLQTPAEKFRLKPLSQVQRLPVYRHKSHESGASPYLDSKFAPNALSSETGTPRC